MTPQMRELYLKVHRGDKRNLPYLHLISMHKNAREMLEFLIAAKLVGRTLTDFVAEKCSGEPIRFLAYLSKEILKVNTAPKLLIGVNFQ